MSKLDISTMIQGGLILVAAGAWNDATRSIIDKIYPKSAETIMAKIWYACIVTFIIIVCVWVLEAVKKPTILLLQAVATDDDFNKQIPAAAPQDKFSPVRSETGPARKFRIVGTSA